MTQESLIDQNKENKYYEVNRMTDIENYNKRIMNRFATMKNLNQNNENQGFQTKQTKTNQLGAGILQGLPQHTNKDV